MTELTTSTAEPAYISRLALQAAPFNNTIDPQIYYEQGQAGQSLNLLLHLMRASDKIAVVIAADGLGKTTLLTQLQQRSGDELRLCWLDGEIPRDADSFLLQCLRTSAVNESEIQATSDREEAFRNQLVQFRKLNIRPVLLVDNTQDLSIEVLQALSNWLEWQENGEYLLQAVLTAKDNFKLAKSIQSRIQVIDLPALTEQELPDYLMYRLSSVGYLGDNLFSSKTLKRFYRLSSGNPARVNQLAHQQLLGLKAILLKANNISWKWVGLALVAVSLTALLIYQDKINQWFITNPNDIELVNIEQGEVVTVVVDSDKNAPTDELPTLVTKTSTHDDQNEIDMAEIERALTEQGSKIEKAQRNELTSLVAEIPEPKKTSQSVEKVKPITTEAVTGVYQQEWVLQQQATHYTFQLLGSGDKKAVYSFINKYALADNVAVIESTRSGKAWYTLFYGAYKDKEQAQDARQQRL